MTHKAIREMFVDALYGELDAGGRARFQDHLHECPSCRNEYENLQRAAGTMSLRERDDLSPEDWKVFMNVHSSAIDSSGEEMGKSHSRTPSFLGRISPALRLGAAAVMILIFGIVIGRYGFFAGGSSTERSSMPGSTVAEKAALREEALGYLDRSKVLLLGIVNAEGDAPEPDQISRQREVSRTLVSEGAPLKKRLSRSGQQQLGQLVEDLEVLLLQIANLEIENDFPGLEIIRGGVDRKGILLKINVEQMKAQQQGSARIPEDKTNSQRSVI